MRFYYYQFQSTRHIEKSASELRTEIKKYISAAFKNYGGAISIDGWTDKYKKIHHFGVSIHFISSENGELVLNDRILLIREMDDDLKKDGAYVKRKIDQYLEEFDLMPHINNITFVTDRGTNMISSLRNNHRVHCFAHLINNTVGKIVKDLECVKAATAIVAYFKKSGKNKFKTTLKSNVSTRWNTVYYMLDSILTHWDEIVSILRTQKVHLNDLAAMSYDELEMLRDFLKKFKEASTELEGSHYPTLYLVNPWYRTLLLHMSPNVRDSILIKKLKEIGLKYWQETVDPLINHFHDIATFLHPMMKGLKAHTPARQQKTYEEVSTMLDRFGEGAAQRRGNNVVTNMTSSAMRLFVDNDSDSEQNELDEYKDLKVRAITDLLQWWYDKKSLFPNLYKIARYIHAIPASSASAERIFSAAGKLSGNRPNLRSELMDEILFLKSNYDLMNKTKRENQLSEFENDNAHSDGYGSDTDAEAQSDM